MTFWHWLQGQTKRRDPIGDLSRDASDDPEAHKGKTKQWWIDHLNEQGACVGAHEALTKAWGEYVLTQQQKKK